MKMNLESIDAELLEVTASLEKELMKAPSVLLPVTSHLATAKGKHMRAAIVIAVARAFKKDTSKVLHLACATELMHLSTLVHDDVIDDAPTRRGIQSVQSKFGKKLAVIAGDYLFTRCFQLVAENHKDRMADFSRAIAVICIGEALQQQYCGNPDITLKQYYKIIAGKTAAMFALSMYGAAIELRASRKTAYRLGKAGYYLGLVFQMVDDCLDYSGDESKTRKTLYTDLEQGIITYPLIYTINHRPELKKYFGSHINENNPLNEQAKREIIDAVNELGGVEATKAQAEKYYNICKTWIHRALPRQDKTLLLNILDGVYYREH